MKKGIEIAIDVILIGILILGMALCTTTTDADSRVPTATPRNILPYFRETPYPGVEPTQDPYPGPEEPEKTENKIFLSMVTK